MPPWENVFCRLNPEQVPCVLVIDDDVEVGCILQRILSKEKFQVHICASLADSVKAIEQRPFDVYVVDYYLTDGTGFDFAELVRSKGSETPIILLSGCDLSALASRAAKLRIFDIIEKPVSRATITNAVKKAIVRKESGVRRQETEAGRGSE